MKRILIAQNISRWILWTGSFMDRHNIRRAIFVALPYTVMIIYCNIWYSRYGPNSKFTEMVRNVDFHDAYRIFSSNPQDPHLPKPVNQAEFKVMFGAPIICKTKDIVIFVKTMCTNHPLRKQIRETWGNAECYSKHGLTAQIMFVLGSAADTHGAQQAECQQGIEEEHLKYQDIVQFDFVDSYRNNTYKLMSMLKYASKECSTARFVLIFDEDFVVNPINVVQTLLKVTHTHYPYYIGGYILEDTKPLRNWADKWFLSNIQYPYVNLPRYPTGGSIVMSMEVAKLLAFGLQYIPFLFIDDLLLGIALHQFGIAPVRIPGVRYHFDFARAERRDVQNLFSVHGFGTVKKQVWGWDRLGKPC